jgi:dihydroorotate dehydrogenase (NAD+) catalytic subunit
MFVRGDKIGGSPAEPTVIAERGYWPADHQKISMANSFGVPSFDPAVWERDLGRSRAVIQEGHQVLIASVVASVDGLDAITEDFVDLALRAQRGGADIIELNYSCPNTRGEFSGEVYQQPKAAAHIARAVREGLAFRQTPIFLKIGYLPRAALAELFMAVAPYVDGIVAINTVSAVVRTPQGGTAFPGGTLGSDRQKAGVSGWAIRNLARDMTTNLVELQRTYFAETGKKVTIVSVGGITTTQEFYDRLTTGADAAAICSAAFLNPLIGLAIRRTEA